MDVRGASASTRRTMAAMHRSDAWLTHAEMKDGISSAALTLLSTRSDPWIERRRTEWGGEAGQKRGAGYEYRLTDRGREAVATLEAQAAH